MCLYSYYYFNSCKHQRIVLLEFCKYAQPVTTLVDSSTVIAIEGGRNDPPTDEDEGSRKSSDTEGAAYDDNSDMRTSVCSPVFTHRSSHSSGTSLDTGSTSITEVPVDSASLPTALLSQSSQALPALPHDMAGLPIFSGIPFRQWMSGGTVTSPLAQSRLRQPGIREHTDESCELPNRYGSAHSN